MDHQQDLFDDHLMHVESMNPKSKGTFYTVNSVKLTCSCKAFEYGMTRPCKHMKSVLSAELLDKVKAVSQSSGLEKAQIKEGNGVSGLYTIGHGSVPVEYLIKVLKENEITTVVDVRSTPFSRHNPQFNRPELAVAFYKEKIRYFYGGKYLGGIGKGCPSIATDGFISHMNKVIAMAETENVSLMCSERNPIECHRAMKLTAYVNQFAPELLPQHITKEGLVDATALQHTMPKKWFWHEFGGNYTVD